MNAREHQPHEQGPEQVPESGQGTWRRRTVVVAASLAALAVVGAGAAMARTGDNGGSTPTLTSTTVSDSAADGSVDALAFNREEERMARDLYTLFADTYGTGPFERIAASEQQHFEAVGTLLAAYDIADPSDGLDAGEYADPAIQELYDTWEAQGLESLDAALQVGVDLEERDTADLEDTLDQIDQADVQAVLWRLLRASQMHLRAFTAWTDGDVGTGQYARNGQGRGMGAGMGGGMGYGAGNGYAEGNGSGNAKGNGNANGYANETRAGSMGDCPWAADDE
jgi:hypothetical protein